MHKFSFFSTQSAQLVSIRCKILSTVRNPGRYLGNLVDVFYPVTCIGCGRELNDASRLLCPVCGSDLPRCEFSRMSNNRGELIFAGRVDIQSVACLYYFKRKGVVQKMMHGLKYHGRQEIGDHLGRILGEEMVSSGRFCEIELVVPVPLHPKKKRRRRKRRRRRGRRRRESRTKNRNNERINQPEMITWGGNMLK